MNILFPLSCSDTEQNQELETRSHGREQKTGVRKCLLTYQEPVLIKHFSMGAMGHRAEHFYPEITRSVILHKTVGIQCGRL